MKGERGGVGIKEFDGLRSKTYSLLVHNNSKQKKAKGVNKHFVEKLIPSEYKDALLNQNLFKHFMNRIQSKNHRLVTYKINKIFLSWFDDEIYILNNRYNILALGH